MEVQETKKEMSLINGIQLTAIYFFVAFFLLFILAISTSQTSKIWNIVICFVAPLIIIITTMILKRIPTKNS